jgi:glutamate N-acetyltransferase / amino-acid N-acetyltransferase
MNLPEGFRSHVANVGIKDATDDFVIVASDRPCTVAGVFTKSRFAGPSVVVSRENIADHAARAMVVISKNANVATGAEGLANARRVVAGVAAAVGCPPGEVLIASTGVIGRQYPMDRVEAGLAVLAWPFAGSSAIEVATGIMTTDTRAKHAVVDVDGCRIVGVAKGVGMIEPDMATMIAMFFTDADLDAATLDAVFRRVVDQTFNCVSVDTDTSTSDTAVILANGAAGPVGITAFESALAEVALHLTKEIARDGEGATKLIEVRVDEAHDAAQAKRVAKSIVNSPLVKTAIHGADPNWGRVAMAVGKCSGDDDMDIDEAMVVIRFGAQEVYPARVDSTGLGALADYMRGTEVLIHVSLGIDTTPQAGCATVWGCDLSDGYIRINADYTT